MYKFNPIESKKVWGRELWLASTHRDGEQKELREALGGDYPLIIKVIETQDTLSVQVHPDNAMASLYENDRGKYECWYVLEAAPDAKLVYGTNGIFTADEIRKAVKANTIVDCLNYVKVKAGDFLYIPAGCVHALGAGLKVLEVQQSSNVTYRLYDWGRDRELHLEKALAVIKPHTIRNVGKFLGVFSCPYFSLEDISFEGSYDFEADSAGRVPSPKDWTALFVVSGSGKAKNSEEEMSLTEGELLMVRPSEKISFEGDLHLIKVMCG